MNIVFLIVLGLLAGYLSGLVGIGGGIIIVPALLFIWGFNQHLAQGTTVALLIPPIGILAAINYYKAGYVDIKTALFISVGFVLGSYLGSLTSIGIPSALLQKIFAVILFFISVKMLFL
jgi:uncharacterized membrane protein YfcA